MLRPRRRPMLRLAAPAGRCLPGVRAVELGLPVPEQARVLLVFVVSPEVLERLGVVDLRLGRPGGRDLRAVEAMARPHRGGSGTAGARGRQDLGGPGARPGTGRGRSLSCAVTQGVHPGAGRRGEQSDRGGRGAEEASSRCGRIRRERRTRLAATPLARAGLARAGLAGAGLPGAGLPGAGHPPGVHLQGSAAAAGEGLPGRRGAGRTRPTGPAPAGNRAAGRSREPGAPRGDGGHSGAAGRSPGGTPGRSASVPGTTTHRRAARRSPARRVPWGRELRVGVVVAKLAVVHALEPRISRARAGGPLSRDPPGRGWSWRTSSRARSFRRGLSYH